MLGPAGRPSYTLAAYSGGTLSATNSVSSSNFYGFNAAPTRGKIAILAGGTGLYFRALIEGLAPMPESDPAIREAITADAAARGWPARVRSGRATARSSGCCSASSSGCARSQTEPGRAPIAFP